MAQGLRVVNASMILIVKQFGSFSVELFMARPQEQQMMLDCDLTDFGKLISEYGEDLSRLRIV